MTIPSTALTRLRTAAAHGRLDDLADPDGTVSVRWRDLEEMLAERRRHQMNWPRTLGLAAIAIPATLIGWPLLALAVAATAGGKLWKR